MISAPASRNSSGSPIRRSCGMSMLRLCSGEAFQLEVVGSGTVYVQASEQKF